MSLFSRRSRFSALPGSIAIDADALDSVFGGFRWQDLPSSPNVIDMSGAPPLLGLPRNYGRILDADYWNFINSGRPGPYEPISPAARDISDRIDTYQRTYGRPVDPPPPGSTPPDPEPSGSPTPWGAPGSLEDQLGYNDIPQLGSRGGPAGARQRFAGDDEPAAPQQGGDDQSFDPNANTLDPNANSFEPPAYQPEEPYTESADVMPAESDYA